MAGRPLHLNRGDLDALMRVHITNPLDWGANIGTDYWFGASVQTAPLVTTQGALFSDHGWIATGLVATEGAGADFISKSDLGAPGNYNSGTQNDLLQSPSIFGDYPHAHAVMRMMNKKVPPRYLIAEFWATFNVFANDEATTMAGFVEDGGSIIVAADAMGAVASDSTNFVLQANATQGGQTLAATTGVHLFRIVLDRDTGKATLGIDGVLYKDAADLVTITADEMPLGFGFGSGGANNFVQPHNAHVWYDWSLPQFVYPA
jgi:hypothetical protein